MSSFLTVITAFPTIIFTILLGVMLLYWSLVIFGLIEIEGIEGVEVDLEVESELDIDEGAFSSLAASLGLSGVPLSLVASLLILFSWLFCYFTAQHLIPLVPGSLLQTLAGVLAIPLSLMLAVPVTVRLIRPIKGIFVVHPAVKKASFVGHRCEIKTLTVTDTFGQALLEDGGAGMILSVRAKSPNTLTKGDYAIIIDYNENDEFYQIIAEKKQN